FVASDCQRLAQVLETLGKECHVKELVAYASHLSELMTTFDFKEIDLFLTACPEPINDLINALEQYDD
ncbi:MAG: hypothetical protein K9L23_20480, partial [Desulfotignum sp.]|nr:hypothetical protein [Desulfotignum sp.]